MEVLRGDLARVLYEHSRPHTEYIFGDSITSPTETAGGVQVTFRHNAPREFALVIGADGLHSNVRRLAFGPEESFVRHLGYYAATWQLPNDLGLEQGSVGYNAPGRLASVGGDHRDAAQARAFFVFASPQATYDRHDLEQQKALIVKVFAGDAACGATIGGMGTGTGVVAAYVLAGELALANGDHRAAFSRYETAMRGYAQGCQKGGSRSGKFLAPGTTIGLRIRNGLLNRHSLMNWMLKEGQKISTINLPDYRSLSRPSKNQKNHQRGSVS
ncbi:hypothetical protein [Streptomyces alanosinicus]|uniref:FAD-binding domain-containing protein n=1 Tax=Streptomyces alanosinicus TaxID=68171 RepID=A0A918YRS0_9ACTN|nr:hypothetical protein [Streptomyces alanosinicus]GHE13422.1 hypothetical protein GCM10010339_80280 [Streptomyces alanosinicus]